MKNVFFKYRNLLLFLFCTCLAIVLAFSLSFKNFVMTIGDLGYLGVFLAGFFYVYTLSALLGIVLILLFSHSLSLLGITIVAGSGAMVADFLIYYFSDKIFTEVEQPLPKNLKQFITRWRKNKQANWLLVSLGLTCLMLPIPDEIGISFMGLSRMRKEKFLLFAFLFNAVGIYLLVQIVQYMHIFS